ncbi:coiled-coil domain-containing protein 110-like [Acipenser ruthenus]|uniref:coiled-coil domain-containing protein 110-like n=1 Tax=Acipenser ruthenus TaxID=7906 RepID=UPI002740C80F|nr:coiled-coil domain-containing protein 110-like [Acipenser ruthenus]
MDYQADSTLKVLRHQLETFEALHQQTMQNVTTVQSEINEIFSNSLKDSKSQHGSHSNSVTISPTNTLQELEQHIQEGLQLGGNISRLKEECKRLENCLLTVQNEKQILQVELRQLHKDCLGLRNIIVAQHGSKTHDTSSSSLGSKEMSYFKDGVSSHHSPEGHPRDFSWLEKGHSAPGLTERTFDEVRKRFEEEELQKMQRYKSAINHSGSESDSSAVKKLSNAADTREKLASQLDLLPDKLQPDEFRDTRRNKTDPQRKIYLKYEPSRLENSIRDLLHHPAVMAYGDMKKVLQSAFDSKEIVVF